MSIYKGTTLIAGALPNSANQDLSNLSQTGQAVIDGKADTDLSNLTSTACTNFDGQWVSTAINMISSTTTINSATTKDYSLSNDLPNDNYVYEVLFTCSGNTGTSSGNTAEISVGSSLCDVGTYRVAFATTRSSSAVGWCGAGIIPIGTDRTISIRQIARSSCSCDFFRIKAYRRIGTNQ